MSVPLSLRICCVAAMAPALTDSNSQTRIQLPGSPPSVVSESPISSETIGVNASETQLSNKGTKTVCKTKIQLSTELYTRGLLTPIHGNGIQHKLLTDKVKKGLQDLGLPTNIPDILKQLAAEKTSLSDDQSTDHFYQKGTSKTMNQPSIGNGPNGTGRRFMKQSSLIEEKALNGHTNNHSAKKITYNKTLLDSAGAANPAGQSLANNTLTSNDKDYNMCQTTESGSGTMVPPASSNQHHNRSNLQKTTQPSNVVTTDSCPTAAAGLEQVVQDAESKPIDLVKDATRKEFLLERRSHFLMRRLRRLQGRQLESHVKSQLKAFVDFQHQNLQTVASRAIRPFSENTFFNCNDVKNLSTSNLVTLVRKLQATQPKTVLEADRKNHRKGVLVMEQGVSSESERKSGQLLTNVRQWNDAIDSAETESSSGGESCEEWEDCPVMSDKKVPTPLHKRAEWRWSTDRAAIVARWTWLQAQVSDLEYRIRQQSEIYKTIRASKGVVVLNDSPPVPQMGPGGDAGVRRVQEMSPANVATLMINVNKQASKLSQSLGNCLSPVTSQGPSPNDKDPSKSLNGFVDGSHTPQTSCNSDTALSSVTVSPDLNNQALDASCVAARCRPLRFYRKRKLLRTAGLHQVNHKAARLSSVKCHCYPPMVSCPMCGGRYNNVQQLDAEGMPIMEKVSLLDPSFHPVLSFPQEIGLTLHFDALLKSGEWQTLKPQPKHTLRSIAAEKRRQKLLNAQLKEQARKKKKYNKTPAALLLSSAKLRSKYDGKSPNNKTSKKVRAETRLRRKELKRRRAAQLAAAALKKSMGDTDMDSASTFSHTPSPSPQMKDGILSHSGSSSTLKDQKDSRKKRFENAYDINNIVIPYSMAASTRVEKLKYKEIQTPKWRDMTSDEPVEEADQPVAMETDQEETSEVEDVSDEAFLTRHDVPETAERKRFRNFVTYPPVRRSRLSRESESNTMDAFSPDCNLTDSFNSTSDVHTGFQFTIGKVDESRRRSGSVSATASRRGSFLEEYMSHIARNSIEIEYMDPFPARQFPLNEGTYEDMKREQLTSSHTKHSYHRARTVRVQDDPSMEFISPEYESTESPYIDPVSPVASVGGSSDTIEDDNDPEWNMMQGDKRSSASMRHSKR